MTATVSAPSDLFASTTDIIEGLAGFVSASPSSFHAAHTVRDALTANGFVHLDEKDAWTIEPGGKYLVVRDGAVLAWIVPSSYAKDGDRAFTVLGTHTDSPAFKLKPHNGFSAEEASQAGVEIYGGPLFNSWLDRELAFAGRLTLRDGRTVLARTEAIGRIPQLAVHLDRQVNDGLKLQKQKHLQPVVGLENLPLADVVGGEDGEEAQDLVLGLLAASAGVDAKDIRGYDVVTIPVQAPEVFGAHKEFFASPRLDNLLSTFPAFRALIATAPEDIDRIGLVAAFDHEEIGSASRSGAAGPILPDITERVVASLATNKDAAREDYLRAIAASICISSDAGHAVHPNYPGHHDPVNRPRLGGGPLLKINAQQRYATDSVGTAWWLDACERAGVTSQPFVSNNDIACGSTIGPITATRLGMTTVDIGPALWSMHSAREMCAVADVTALHDALYACLVRG